MAFVKPTINIVKPDIKNASIYLRSTKKWGKSTLFARVIEEKYNDPSKGLLVEVGNEHGTTMLDNVNRTHVDTYQDFIELQQWILSTRGTENNIEIVAFDTTDEMIEPFEKETIRRSNLANPAKPVKSINAAMGGYGEGPKYTASLIKEYMNAFKVAGISTWAIGHTKYKTIKDKGNIDTEGYLQLTSNLSAPYEAAFGDIFDITLTGVVDRDVEVVGEGENSRNRVTEAVRKLYFRGTPEIDAGGRFASDTVPEFMVFEGDMREMARKFIDTIESGMTKSKTLNAKEEKKVEAINSKIEATPVAIPTIEPEVDPEELRTEIKTKFKDALPETKINIKNHLDAHCGGKIVDASAEDLVEIKKILDRDNELIG